MKNSMITWMKDRNETRAGQGTGKKEQVPSPGFYERKKACSVTCRMLDEKNGATNIGLCWHKETLKLNNSVRTKGMKEQSTRKIKQNPAGSTHL